MTDPKKDLSIVKKAEEQKPVLSIIIVARNELQYTVETVKNAVIHTRLKPEIIVVDNATTDGTKEWLESQKYITNIRINQDHPVPYGIALNEGMKVARGEYFALCNNDIILTSGWDDCLSMLIENNNPEETGIDKIGIVSPMTNSAVVNKRQRVEENVLAEKKYSAELAEPFSKFWANFIMSNPDRKKYERASTLSNFCWMMTRQCYEEVGEFEVYEPYGFENEDYLIRMMEKGFTALICRFAFVHHYGINETVDQGYPMEGIAYKPVFYENYKNRHPGKSTKKVLVAGYRVKNVERWFERVLAKMSEVADKIVVFDDHSTDKTIKIAESFDKVVKIHQSDFKDFNEARDRDFLWHLCQDCTPDWIIINDGDELLEDKFTRKEVEILMNPKDPKTFAYFVRYISLWDSEEYQHQGEVFGNLGNVRMVKNLPNTHIVSKHPQGFHCNSTPPMPKDSEKVTKFRIQHFGNMDKNERLRKYKWYQKTDTEKNPRDIGGENYKHLLNQSVPLVKFTPTVTMDFMTIMKDEMRDPCHLIQFLDEYHLFFDNMIIVDTGSTDNSIEIAKYYGAKVYKYSWNGDFAAARNFGLKRCKSDWIFWADLDERLGHNIWKWRKLIEEPVLSYLVPILNFLPGGKKPFVSKNWRIFRNVPGVAFKSPVHEGPLESLEKIEGHGLPVKIAWEDQPMFPGFVHFGFLRKPKELIFKMKSYVKLCSEMLEKNPDDHYPHFSLGLDEATKKNESRAIYHLEQCLKIKPDFTQAKAKLATCYMRKVKKICEGALNENGTSHGHKLAMQHLLQVITPFAPEEHNLGLNTRYSEDG